ncbi:SMI1/KNR4 family protein [Chryseobacterium sp.]|uniref:SMI1/KNR4 family protein n=1 Tax=Chryseobacterium sp. TaxID=1871047 RepID=UPI002FC5A36E
MKIIVKNPKQKITLSDIKYIESEFSFTMPESLKKLYLKYNGGIIDIDEDYYRLNSIKYGNLLLVNTIDTMQITEKNIPREYIPFANTEGGHFICIYVKAGSKNGQIYLFRHDELEPIFYNNSLEEFLNVDSIEEL